ncbi:MAG: 1-acyl-sn-glycerol-3-phosphate acyltransferase [Acholeplasmatales bacterium]|nr:1-acyl-sn-glycerol-3-phosphate acyltransferase [Acholeplasmatales bacterium]
MFLLFLILLMTIGYSLMFYFVIDLSPYYMFLWVPVSLLLALITFVIMVYIFLVIGYRTKPNNRFKHFILRSAMNIFLKFYHIKLEVVGKENLPNDTYIIYSNHKSNMDPIFIYLATHSHEITAIGKHTLFKNYFMNLIRGTYGAYSLNRDNDREAAKTIVKAIGDAKNGMSIIIFPEGGIKTRDVEEMVNLRAGAYKVATKSGVQIVPCAIVGSSQIKTLKRRKRKNITVIFFKPIKKEEYASMNTTSIGLMVEDIINAGIKNYGKNE